MAATVPQPVPPQVVGIAFVQQYYHILHQSPGLVHRFYQDTSKLGRPEDNGAMSITTTMKAINEKILSLNYGEFRAEIKSVDAQESFNGGVHVLVTGYLTGTDNNVRNFAQTFFLAPQDKGFFVLNDIFRYAETVNQHGDQGPVHVEAPVTPEQEHSPATENNVPVQTSPLPEEDNEEEVYNPPENVEAPIVEEEIPIAEVVDEVQDDSQMIVETKSKIEVVPKKSYASIVMDTKERSMPFSSPAPAPRRSVIKSQEQKVNLAPPQSSTAETTNLGSDAIENGNIQEEEADGYSIYVKGLPMNATPDQLEVEFKKFGPIKTDGVQVRSNKMQGFCFGFVEFQDASAVQKAIEASPVTIGGRQTFVEEKRSTNSRGNYRARFSTGRGSGFRNEGSRGRGNYGGGRGFNRGGDFNGRSEFGNKGGSNRGGFSNRGGDGFQRVEYGRLNRTGGSGMAINGSAKPMAPRVSASA